MSLMTPIITLVYDYVIDAGLSFLDEFFGGVAGLDAGDLIAAVLIYMKERKATGQIPAMICAWEATNFIPISLIPGIGTITEIVTNLFPAVSVTRFIFSKEDSAKKEANTLEKNVKIAEFVKLDVKKEKEALNNIKSMIFRENFVDSLKKGRKANKEIGEKLNCFIKNVISETKNMISKLSKQSLDAPKESLAILEEGIKSSMQMMNEAEEAAKANDFEKAINQAEAAKRNIIDSVNRYDQSL